MFILVSYDIVDDRQRQRIAKVLNNYGYRVQKSVFECQLDDRLYLKMRKQVEKLLDMEKDSVRYYFFCGRCQGNIEVSGWGAVREEEETVIV